MADFANIVDNIVVRVIVVSNAKLENYTEPLTIEQAKEIAVLASLGGEWVQTSFNGSFRGKFAAKGDKYENDTFISTIVREDEPIL